MDYTKDAVLIEDLKLKAHSHNLSSIVDTRMDDSERDLVLHLNHSSSTSLHYDECQEDSNGTMCFLPYSMRPETYIVPILFAIIFIIGVLGNGTLILIFLKHKSMRNVPNMYIVSLAVGDLCVILFCVPFTSTIYTIESWPYGEFVCKFSEFIKDLSVGVSVFTLTALSADRYFAIKDPMRKLHGRRATRITCVTIIGIWMLSTLMAVPSAVFPYVRAIDDDPSRIFYVCYPFPPDLGVIYPKVMVMYHFLGYYAIPLGFIATFYIIMARHLVLSTQNMPGEAQGQAKQIQARKKVAKMILSFVVIFALCFFPQHLFLLWFYFDPLSEHNYNDFWHACRIIGFCFSFLNSCVNPITLYCVSGTFRKQFNENLFCCCCDAEGKSRGTVRRTGLVCGCVSLSGAGQQGQLFLGGESRFRNGYTPGRALHRASTTNSVNGTMKRKSTWDTTQITVSQHNLYNITLNNQGGQQQKGNTPTSNNSPPEFSKPLATFPMTHQSSSTRTACSDEPPKTFLSALNEHHNELLIDEDPKTVVTTSFMNQPNTNAETDIISGIECSCKASLVQKISQQNNNYD